MEGLLISEVLPGIAGVNNNLEFIEIYNRGGEAVDLNGWSLWYRLADNKEEALVYAWEERADIPAAGHFLLARAGEDVGNIADAEYELALFEKKGGLALRDPSGDTMDTLVWGEGPTDFLTGLPALVPEDGASLERLPGGPDGNATSVGDDAADFAFNTTPTPQNSGDPVTPLPAERLAIHLELPATAEPGSELLYTVELQNLTGETVHDVRAWIPVPAGLEVLSMPPGASQVEGGVEWVLDELAGGATETGTVLLQTPWTYLTDLVRGSYVEAADGTLRAYGPLVPLAVEGGSIPIGTARTLKGETVTVEGVATMYTGAFYSGSTGTKFYLEDETGGIQAYCPGGMGLVEVDVGDRVRVTGLIELYRDSMEIIPSTYPDDVEMLERGGSEPEPLRVTLDEASNDESLLGRLIEVEGTATRIEEFSYSYEVDLMDELGNLLLAYIEKETGVTTEPLDVGNDYRVTGISEMYDGEWQIKPRYQADLADIFPPELMLVMDAPNSALPGETITYALTAYNHTDAPLTNVRIEATPPSEGVTELQLRDGGQQDGDTLVWIISELAPHGGSATVQYAVTVLDDASGQILAEAAVATADEWLDPAMSDPALTFAGSGVPIWAIQGPGFASPYVRTMAATEGIVTGVFPEFHGFWIQEVETDDDPATSAGLYVLTGAQEVPVEAGDRVQIQGKVREMSGQTLMEILAPEDVNVASSGNELPAAVELDPPIKDDESQAYYEALEGMLVQVSEPAIAVGPTSKYGETPLVRSEWQVDRVMRGDPRGMLIFVDDGSAGTHYDITTLPFAVQTGDTITGIVGPLAYTYENYKIEPIATPAITPTQNPLPVLEPAGPNKFSIATFNVENLFDTYDPHPSDPPIPTTPQYKLDLDKTANTILDMGAPTIVGLQEVENLDILVDLAAEEAIAGYGYQPALIEGTDSRGIDVGYLVRGDQATLVGVASLPAPDGLTSRPPLLITTTVHLESGDATVYVLNNHFTSMSGGEKPTEPRRTAQAAWNVALVEEILAKEPDAHVVVLGDLNSFYDSPPLDELRGAGLRHVYELTEPAIPYTYIFQGDSETLDHILMTPSLYDRVARVEVLHVNADYPPPLLEDPSARRSSDHDPLVVIVSFE
jgi:predicted extracellular nuclease